MSISNYIRLFFLSSVFQFLASTSVLALETGDTAPDLAPTSALRLDLAKKESSLIYLDFWASWCGPCKISLPWMNELSEQFKDSELHIIAVNLDKDRDSADELLKIVAPRYKVLFDPEGKLPLLYDVTGMPSSYLIGKGGRIIKVYSGFSDDDKKIIENDIKEALEKER